MYTDPFWSSHNTIIGMKAVGDSSNNTIIGYTSSGVGASVVVGSVSTAGGNSISIGNEIKASTLHCINIGFDITNDTDNSIIIGDEWQPYCKIGGSSFTTYFEDNNNTHEKILGITFNEQPKLKAGLTPTKLTDIVHKQYVDETIFRGGDKTKQ
jgi:hypothetical protein